MTLPQNVFLLPSYTVRNVRLGASKNETLIPRVVADKA
jgi:hypothetical protein